MPTTMPDQYYNRFDQSQDFEEHLFIAGRGLQSAELNEIQRRAASRTRGIADAIFKDGDVIRDAAVVVDQVTGVTQCSSGAIYLRGAVRGLPPSTLTVPLVGTIAIGVRLIESVVTHVQDPSLLDPATGTRNYNEPGAARLRVSAAWGWSGDGGLGDFFPVYTVVDGFLLAKEPPPNIDIFTQTLSRYDRDSAGGMYVVSGMSLQALPNVGSNQVYSLSEGRARVYGYGIEFTTSRRITHAAVPDLKVITNEPHLSASSGTQRVNIDRPPCSNTPTVSITAEKTVSLTHGVFSGAQDVLPDTSVLAIVEVKQGATTYTQGVDYQLTAGKVDWSLAGAEPAPGSTYTAKYHHITQVTPTAVDDRGFTVTGAVVGTIILLNYSQMLPRIDRLCLTTEGDATWVVGVSADFNPLPPSVPVDLLPVASVYQSWDSNRRVLNDGVRVVTMPKLASIEGRIDRVLQLVAQNRLESNIHTRESGAKLGLFTDPFLDDSQRDAGIPQTGAIVRGELMLPIDGVVHQMPSDVTSPTTLNFSHAVSLQQPLRTGSMKINPYMAFAPAPTRLVITPSVDRWTVDGGTVWTSPITTRFESGATNVLWSFTSSTTRNEMVGIETEAIETLRQIEVQFEISGFGPGENLQALTFDGLSINPTAI